MRKNIISLTVVVLVFCFTGLANAEGLEGLALGFRPTFHIAPELDDFKVVERGWFLKKTTSIQGNTLMGLGVFSRYGFTENLGIEGAYDILFGGGLSDSTGGLALQIGSLSAIAMFLPDRSFKPYLKAGVCYGQFDWNGPGDFDGAVGFQGGAGFELSVSEQKHSTLGLEVLYRYLENDYNAPSNATASADSIDLSGIGINIDMVYRF